MSKLSKARWMLRIFASLALTASGAQAADLRIAKHFFSPDQSPVIEQSQGNPPAAIVRGVDGRILGYAFSTYEVSGSVGYAGRPLDIVAAVTPEGIIAGAQIVAHEEPILVIGIPRDALAAYVSAFKGFDISASAGLKQTSALTLGPHAVAGATITSTVIRDAIVRSARAVWRSRSTVADNAARLDRETLRRSSWQSLLAEGAVQRLLVSRGDAAKLLGTRDTEPDKPFIDLWLALATPPPIGESLLGQQIYESELAKIGSEDDLVLIGATGLYSFKGAEWRQSDSFSRIELIQGDRTIRLKPADHTAIEALTGSGRARTARDRGVSHRTDKRLRPDQTVPARSRSRTRGSCVRARCGLAGLPNTRSISDRTSGCVAVNEITWPEAQIRASAPGQVRCGKIYGGPAAYEIAVLGAMLAVLGGILIFQDRHRARPLLLPAAHRLSIADLRFPWLIANAQLSVVHVLTFIHALLSGFRWELFLLDPHGVPALELRRDQHAVLGTRRVLRLAMPVRDAAGADQPARPTARHQADRNSLWAARTALDDQICSFRRHPGDFAALDRHGRSSSPKWSRSRPLSR